MLVFEDAHLDAQLHGDTGFAFADPFGVGLKDGEDFFVMQDAFTLNDTPVGLINLAYVRIPVNVTADSGNVTGIPANVTEGRCCAF